MWPLTITKTETLSVSLASSVLVAEGGRAFKKVVWGKGFRPWMELLLELVCFGITFIQGRISWGIHGLPKVSLGPAMSYHSVLWVATLETNLQLFQG